KKRSRVIPCDEGVLGNMVCECSPFVLRLPPIPKIWAKWRSCLLSIPDRYGMDRVDSNDDSVASQYATIVRPHDGFSPRMTCCGGRERAMLILTPAETSWLRAYHNLLATEFPGCVEEISIF